MELYENTDAFKHRKNKMENGNKKTQNTGPTARGDRCYKLAGVFVLLVCFLLLIATTALGIKYSIQTTEKEELVTRQKALTEERDEWQSRYRETTLENDFLKEKNQNLMTENKELQSRLDYTDTLENQQWKPFISSLYYISVRKNWTKSKEDCKNRGGHLAIINSLEEENFINNQLEIGEAWIGLSDTEKEGTWKWVDGTTLNPNSQFWRTNEPNGNTAENCAAVSDPVGRLSWNDNNCAAKMGWICQKKLN